MINSFRDVMRGHVGEGGTSQHHHYRIDTKRKKITQAPMFGPNFDSEFPCIDSRVSCRQNNRLFMLSHTQSKPVVHNNLNEVSSFRFSSGARQTYRYPDAQIPEEYLFVSKPGNAAETDGWGISTALDWQNKKTLLNVFDADHVDDGPVATATLEYFLPLGLYGKFVSQT
jgi:all-trans-8'-apo-beta-carotenal 15,15'-oxygenase